MTFAVPLAWLGLLTLPILWWLHRRMRRPPVVSLPSLMFLVDEDDARSLPKGRRVDLPLIATLGAATLLTIAAAGPRMQRHTRGRTVRVVVDRGAMDPRSTYLKRVATYLSTLEQALGDEDRLVRVNIPTRIAGGDDLASSAARRASPEAIRGVALAGDADIRVAISDSFSFAVEAEQHADRDIQWVELGGAADSNVGIVSVSARRDGEALSVFVNVRNESDREQAVHVLVDNNTSGFIPLARARLSLQPNAHATTQLRVSPDAKHLRVGLVAPNGEPHHDALPDDDNVWLTARRPLVVEISTQLPTVLRKALEDAMTASLKPEGWMPASTADVPDLAFASASRATGRVKGLRFVLGKAASDQGKSLARRARFQQVDHPLLRDVSLRAIPRSAWSVPRRSSRRGDLVLARWTARDESYTAVSLLADGTLRVYLDPSALTPAVLRLPWFPLWIDNSVAYLRGRGTGPYFIRGLMDVDSSRLGRRLGGPSPGTVASRVSHVRVEQVSLRVPCLLSALALLLVLWAWPAAKQARLRHTIGSAQAA